MSENYSNVVALKDAREIRERRSRIENALSLHSLALSVNGNQLLKDVSAVLPGDGITVIMGPNGAGKSLLLRVIAGLIKPSQGSIQFSQDVSGRVSLVFQKPVLLRRTVRQNLEHALKIYKTPKEERKDRLLELLSIGGLNALADRPARTLSGGEQQRIGLVRALASNPKLLLADEPTASLDPTSTKAIELLLKGAAERGTKVVLVTHDQGQAKRMGDDILFLNRGISLEHTKASDFFHKPLSIEARAFLEGELL